MKHLSPILAALLVGCAANRDKSVLVKSTVLGLEVAPGASAPAAPAIRLGLVRNQYVAVPTNATLTAISEGDIRTTRQQASEELVFGAHLMPPRGASASVTNTVKVKGK